MLFVDITMDLLFLQCIIKHYCYRCNIHGGAPIKKILCFSYGSMDMSQTFTVSIHTIYPVQFIKVTNMVQHIQQGLGERSSSSSSSGLAQPPSAFWRILGLNLRLFEYIMLLTDTLSHNIISHKRDTNEPIIKAVSKYRIQTLSSLTEQVVLRS